MSPQKSKNQHKFTISTHINTANICKYIQNLNLNEHLKTNKTNPSIHPLNQPPRALHDFVAASMQLAQMAASKGAPLERLETNWFPRFTCGPVGVAKQPTHQDKDINPNQILEIKLKKSVFVVVCWLLGSLEVCLLSSSCLGCTVLKKRGGNLQVKC